MFKLLGIILVIVAGYYGITGAISAWESGTFKYLVGAILFGIFDLILLCVYVFGGDDVEGGASK